MSDIESRRIIVVALKRCEECGLATIIGQVTGDGTITRMNRDLFNKAREAQILVHASVLPSNVNEIVSIRDFQFSIVDTDWHCGCF